MQRFHPHERRQKYPFEKNASRKKIRTVKDQRVNNSMKKRDDISAIIKKLHRIPKLGRSNYHRIFFMQDVFAKYILLCILYSA